MRAIKCDRCEKYYDPYKPKGDTKFANMITFAEDRGDGYIETRQFELCKDCMKELVSFMQDKFDSKE